ncbi:hypothetical protein KSP39_PZI010410 [Platanthera zijinensis]|uniref:Transposase (putative) gypsy type domain-containing protein n=1 Tax=Platanthera zijinensis TaxID=2320716 RepID=A0AAP0BKC9_9ASPA
MRLKEEVERLVRHGFLREFHGKKVAAPPALVKPTKGQYHEEAAPRKHPEPVQPTTHSAPGSFPQHIRATLGSPPVEVARILIDDDWYSASPATSRPGKRTTDKRLLFLTPARSLLRIAKCAKPCQFLIITATRQRTSMQMLRRIFQHSLESREESLTFYPSICKQSFAMEIQVAKVSGFRPSHNTLFCVHRFNVSCMLVAIELVWEDSRKITPIEARREKRTAASSPSSALYFFCLLIFPTYLTGYKYPLPPGPGSCFRDLGAPHFTPLFSSYCEQVPPALHLAHSSRILLSPSRPTMGKRKIEEGEGRSRCGKRFGDHDFPPGRISEEEYNAFTRDFLPADFESRPPKVGESINTFYPDEIAFPVSHFEAGLRLPLWPEVKQVLKYFGTVPAQLNPNAISVLVAFACYMRRERIEFSLNSFRKLFIYHANADGVSYFTGQGLKVCETPNKNHHWLTRFVFIRGHMGGIPRAPVSPAEVFYTSPQVSGTDKLLCDFFAGKNFEVQFLRRGLDSLLPVLPGEGERTVPVRPPYKSSIKPSKEVALATMATEAAKDTLPPPLKKRTAEDSAPSRPSPSKKTKTKKGVPPSSGKAKRVRATVLEVSGSLSPISLGSQSPKSPSQLPHRRAVSPIGETGQPTPPADKLPSSSKSPTREASSSSRPAPSTHPNFNMGPSVPDAADDPTLIWDQEVNRVSISTLLPPWVERDRPTAHAFSLSFGLYGGSERGPAAELPSRDLIMRSAQSHLRSLELSHQLSRRLIFNNQKWRESEANLAAEREKSTDLEKRLATAENLLAKARGGVDAETADRMHSRIAHLEEEIKGMESKIIRLQEAALSPSRGVIPQPPPPHYSHAEVEELCKDANIRTAELVIKMMKEMEVVKEGCEDVTARHLAAIHAHRTKNVGTDKGQFLLKLGSKTAAHAYSLWTTLSTEPLEEKTGGFQLGANNKKQGKTQDISGSIYLQTAMAGNADLRPREGSVSDMRRQVELRFRLLHFCCAI